MIGSRKLQVPLIGKFRALSMEMWQFECRVNNSCCLLLNSVMMLGINAYVTSCKLAVAVGYSKVRAAAAVYLVEHIYLRTSSKI